MQPSDPDQAPAQPAQSSIQIMNIWPSTLFVCDWAEFPARAAGIEALVRAQAAGFSKPVESAVAVAAKPAAGLVESPLQLFESSDDPDLAALARWIEACVLAAVVKVNGDAVAREKLHVTFNESWFHITNGGGFHDAHVHGDCSWCGIFYLRAGDAGFAGGAAGNGVNRFYAPMNGGGRIYDYGSKYLGNSYVDIEPREGRLVVFPSYLLHSALPYQGTRDRIIISFNSRTDRIDQI